MHTLLDGFNNYLNNPPDFSQAMFWDYLKR